MNHHPDFPSMLFDRAIAHPDRTAITFLSEERHEISLSYWELWKRSVDVANTIGRHFRLQSDSQADSQAGANPRALLLFPPGIDFFPAFLGAQLANCIPVPTNYPKPYREMPRLNSCARDCTPSIILSDAQTLATLDRSKLDPAADVPGIAVDQLQALASPDFYGQRPTGISANSTAFLQYTSGSTSDPKGVVVSQQNLMSNLEAIRTGFGLNWVRPTDQTVATSVFWLPHFHDMGLIGGVLAPLYIGFRTVLMSPQSFVRRPIQWLRMVQQYRALVTGAPNFAFELCADRISPQQAQGLDLSSLRVMFCGAEPIRATALRAFETRFATAGFSPEAFYPCYGLAESTLLACGGRGPGRPHVLAADRQSLRQGTVRVASNANSANTASLVACGQPTGTAEMAIVDPESRRPLPERQIGEIWLRGPSIAAGYWKMTQEHQDRFHATLESKRTGLSAFWGGDAKSSNTSGDSQPYFRTGDLGFLHNGQLYITGRIKELIIVRGRNYFPQDIEASVLQIDSQQFPRVAAVSIDGPRGEALGVVIETSRRFESGKLPSFVRQIRRQIIDEHDVDPREVVIVATGSIPVTTSGKLRRNDSRSLFSPDAAAVLHRWCRSNATESPPIDLPALPDAPTQHDFQSIRDRVCEWMVLWLIVRGGIDAEQIDVARRFEDYGLDSLMAIELVGDLEDACDVELTPTVAMRHPT
ncbi:MAG TPA: fatty acyl-AMP ligase, partial [Planctomycetaceae bacterium]|nr:fatty acyl-AMP ligase [Planctomycetaceae bacterium]